MSDDDKPDIETCLTVAEDECRYTEYEVRQLAAELAQLRRDAACWQRLREEMAFYATGPLPNESAIVQRHMTLAEEHVKRQEMS